MTREKQLQKLIAEVKWMIAHDKEETDKFKQTIEKIKKLRKAIDK